MYGYRHGTGTSYRAGVESPEEVSCEKSHHTSRPKSGIGQVSSNL